MAFLLFREPDMDTTAKQQPTQPADAEPSPVRVNEPEASEATTRPVESPPEEPHEPVDEPGYGHGV
jgi:hypothetical protein